MIALETEEVMGLKVPPDPNFGKSVDPDQTAGVISFIFGVDVALVAVYASVCVKLIINLIHYSDNTMQSV